MFSLLLLWIRALLRLFRSRGSLVLENLALRQQLTVLKRQRRRPSLGIFDKIFWVVARRVWSGWKHSLIIVTPETVVRWHRAGFRLYWRLISKARARVGRMPTSKGVRDLIFQMVAENPTWGAPRIHGELLMLGFDLSGRTISRWMKRAPRDPEAARRWLTFLRNHREVIAAMDFFTVPTITFGFLYCFFVIGHDLAARARPGATPASDSARPEGKSAPHTAARARTESQAVPRAARASLVDSTASIVRKAARSDRFAPRFAVVRRQASFWESCRPPTYRIVPRRCARQSSQSDYLGWPA